MKFVADEGIEAEIVNRLRAEGHDVLYIAEFAASSQDDAILKFSNEENRIVLTRDKDFGDLVFRDKLVHSGIVLNRLFQLSSSRKAEIVSKVISEYSSTLEGSFTVIEPGRLRIRKMN